MSQTGVRRQSLALVACLLALAALHGLFGLNRTVSAHDPAPDIEASVGGGAGSYELVVAPGTTVDVCTTNNSRIDPPGVNHFYRDGVTQLDITSMDSDGSTTGPLSGPTSESAPLAEICQSVVGTRGTIRVSISNILDSEGTLGTGDDVRVASNAVLVSWLQPVGGIAEYPGVAGTGGDSGWWSGSYAEVAALAAVLALALSAGGWYARRRLG